MPIARRRHGGVHRFHPAGDLSAEPGPEPRQLAHADAASRSELLLRPDLRHALQLQRLPYDRSGRQRRTSASPRPAFSAPTDGRASSRSRSSSRSPISATCTRRSGCSAWRRSPFFNAGDNGSKGDQVRGFGFLHDGSVDTLFRFHQARGLQLPPRQLPERQPGRLSGRRGRRRDATQARAVHARLRQQPGAHRRAADHPDGEQRRRGRSSHRSSPRPRRRGRVRRRRQGPDRG